MASLAEGRSEFDSAKGRETLAAVSHITDCGIWHVEKCAGSCPTSVFSIAHPAVVRVQVVQSGTPAETPRAIL